VVWEQIRRKAGVEMSFVVFGLICLSAAIILFRLNRIDERLERIAELLERKEKDEAGEA
tara:strand:+ start:50 stop:226 length:177 start_codon:yes stop_codon:yes gene_type:complete